MTLITLTPAPRRLDVPRWAVGVVCLWATSVAAAAVWLTHAGIEGSQLCLFRRVTGVPCATCGSTRAAFAAFDGRLLDAFLLNPFVCGLIAVGVVWLATRLALGRRVVVQLTRGQIRGVWAVLSVLFAANWAWVILRDG